MPKVDLTDSDLKYILAGLRIYGDMLAETCEDLALHHEEREKYAKDSTEVESLIKFVEAVLEQ